MNNYNRFISDFLFSSPSFLSGAGTVINLSGNYYKFNVSKTGHEADYKAIQNDFNMVGQDIADTLEKVKTNKNTLIFS